MNESGITLSVKAIPSAGRQKIFLDKNGSIKCYLLSQPEDGKANKELITFLSSLLAIRKSAIYILHGLTQRKKVIHIQTNMPKNTLLQKLGLEMQSSLSL